jgi:hypothetical protein
MSTHNAVGRQELRPGPPSRPTPRPGRGTTLGGDQLLLRLGAVLAVVGLLLQVPLSFWHPHQADPNDSAGAFAEYAQSNNWVLVHIGQFTGALLITLGLVALARHLSRQPGITGALAILGGAAAVLVAAVFAVQMAVDGVALKATIDAWTIADGSADKAAAFLVADGIRSLEKALSGFFHLCNGVTLLALGLALATGRGFPRWLGWVGAAAGTAFLVEGVVVAQTGFSHQAANIALVPTVLLPVFLIGVAVAMWRTTPISQEGEPVQGTLTR